MVRTIHHWIIKVYNYIKPSYFFSFSLFQVMPLYPTNEDLTQIMNNTDTSVHMLPGKLACTPIVSVSPDYFLHFFFNFFLFFCVQAVTRRQRVLYIINKIQKIKASIHSFIHNRLLNVLFLFLHSCFFFFPLFITHLCRTVAMSIGMTKCYESRTSWEKNGSQSIKKTIFPSASF